MVARKKELKTLQMSFRLTESCKDALLAVAARENRSVANALEVAVLFYAATTGVDSQEFIETAPKKKAVKKVARKK